MKKKLIKLIAAACAVVAMATSLVGCGNKAPEPAKVDKTFTTMQANYIDAIGWYQQIQYELQLNADGTYELVFDTTRFGAEDCDMRGIRLVTYTGTYTSAASADGEPSHLDVTLAAPVSISWNQQGKGFTRVATLPGNFYISTATWTDAMTTVYDPEGNAKKAEDFLAEFGHEVVITVEDSTVDPEDTTLSNRIVTLPELGIENGEG